MGESECLANEPLTNSVRTTPVTTPIVLQVSALPIASLSVADCQLSVADSQNGQIGRSAVRSASGWSIDFLALK